jgi:hypothetical protein
MYQLCLQKKINKKNTGCSVIRSVSKSLKKVRHEMQFDGENESFNTEFIWNNTPIQ